MKLWFSLTLVCCALVYLILSFTRVVGLNHPWQVVGSGPWLDRGREPASDAPTVSVVTSIEFDSACAGPWQSLVLDGALTADHAWVHLSDNDSPLVRRCGKFPRAFRKWRSQPNVQSRPAACVVGQWHQPT